MLSKEHLTKNSSHRFLSSSPKSLKTIAYVHQLEEKRAALFLENILLEKKDEYQALLKRYGNDTRVEQVKRLQDDIALLEAMLNIHVT